MVEFKECKTKEITLYASPTTVAVLVKEQGFDDDNTTFPEFPRDQEIQKSIYVYSRPQHDTITNLVDAFEDMLKSDNIIPSRYYLDYIGNITYFGKTHKSRIKIKNPTKSLVFLETLGNLSFSKGTEDFQSILSNYEMSMSTEFFVKVGTNKFSQTSVYLNETHDPVNKLFNGKTLEIYFGLTNINLCGNDINKQQPNVVFTINQKNSDNSMEDNYIMHLVKCSDPDLYKQYKADPSKYEFLDNGFVYIDENNITNMIPISFEDWSENIYEIMQMFIEFIPNNMINQGYYVDIYNAISKKLLS